MGITTTTVKPIRTVGQLQQDVGELLQYLHLTEEEEWDKKFILNQMVTNMNLFNENIIYYKTPVDTREYIKLVYCKADMEDPITTLTERHKVIGSLKLKDQYIEDNGR